MRKPPFLLATSYSSKSGLFQGSQESLPVGFWWKDIAEGLNLMKDMAYKHLLQGCLVGTRSPWESF